SADLIVLPYKKIFQSGVLIMAMSYAKAVLASNLPANQEIIEDGVNGFLFESENAESLAAKLEEIAANQETLPEVAKAARIHMEKHYSWEEQADIIIHQWLNQENLAPLAAEKFSE
ncbi:MAG: glycosyltransferase, partial [Luteibaculum sp.]